MAYKPIAEAGIPFTFSQDHSTPVLNGSTVFVGTQLQGPSWSIAFDDDVARNVRVTVANYSSQRVQGSEAPSYFEFTAGDDPSVTVTNEIPESANEFVPNPVSGRASRFVYQAGFGSELFRDEQYEMLVEVEPDRGACEEFGRVTRAYVSAYDRTRVHEFRLFANERRCLVANFNGAIPKGETIAKVEWRMDMVQSLAMSDAAIDGREARVMIQARYVGRVNLRCEATLGNGEVYTQLFAGRVMGGANFGDAVLAAGPGVLVAEA